MATARVFNHHIHKAFIWLTLVEALVFIGAFYLGAYFYFYSAGGKFEDHLTTVLPQATIFSFVGLASLAAMGLNKPLLREGSSGIVLRLMGAFVLLILAMALVFYALPQLYLWRGIFAQTVVIAFLAILLERYAFNKLVDVEQLKARVLVLGAGKRAQTMTNALRRASDRRGFTFIGFVHIDEGPHFIDDARIVALNGSLVDFVEQHQVDRIIAAPDDRRGNIPVEELLQCRLRGVDILEVSDFFEREAGKIMLDFITPTWLTFSDGFDSSMLSRAAKRGFDIIASLLLLLVAWPLIFVAILLILIEDGPGAPVVYRQERVGENGRVFRVLKLRSMSVNAESGGKAIWAAKNDTRITQVGQFIRRTRIDELPQIINILTGDMSLVGPRPERPEFVEELEQTIPYFSVRHQVKPGIAGWAQLNFPYGASKDDARQKLQYDLYYVKNNSLFLDFMILITTIEVVLFGNGVR